MKSNNTALYVKLGVGIAAAALLYVKRDEISAAVSNAFASIKSSASSAAFTPAATYAPASIAAPAAALTAPAAPEAAAATTAAMIADALALSKKRAAEERAKTGRPSPVAVAPKGAAARPVSAAQVQKVVNKINANPAAARAAYRAVSSGNRFARPVRSA